MWIHSVPMLPCAAGHPNQLQPCLTMPCGPPSSHCGWGPEHWSECSPQPQGFRHLLRSCGHHVMIMQPCATQATLSAGHLASGPGTWGSQPLYFPSSSILLHANAPLISPQQLHTYLPSFLTRRLIVCTPMPHSHPQLFYPHVDSTIFTDILLSGFSQSNACQTMTNRSLTFHLSWPYHPSLSNHQLILLADPNVWSTSPALWYGLCLGMFDWVTI